MMSVRVERTVEEITDLPKTRRTAAAILFAWYKEGATPETSDHWYARDTKTGIVYSQIANTCPYPVSYLDINWWKAELRSIKAAGFDIAAVQTYPGVPSTMQGFPVLAKAWQELKAAGEHPVPIGFFFEVNWLSGYDLTTPTYRDAAWNKFYAALSALPQEMWRDAYQKDMPFFGYYIPTGVVKGWNRTFFDDLRARMQGTYGVNPLIVAEAKWSTPTQPMDDAVDHLFQWSTHLNGPVDMTQGEGGGCVNIFCAYERGVCQPWHLHDYLRLREDGISGYANPTGTWYDYCWQKAIAQDAAIVLCQWNELAEAVTLCQTVQFGDRYIHDSAAWIRLWKEGGSPSTPVVLQYPDRVRRSAGSSNSPVWQRTASVDLDFAKAQYGWWTVESGGGLRMLRGIADARAVWNGTSLVSNENYEPDFAVFDWGPDAFARNVPTGTPYRISVTLTDAPESAGAIFYVQYDSHAASYKTAGPLTVRTADSTQVVRSGVITLVGDGKRKTLEWTVADARWDRQQNGATQFRLVFYRKRPVVIHRVSVTDVTRVLPDTDPA